MLKIIKSDSASALFVTLFTIMITVVLANAILNIIGNQSRMTHHQVSRIQAYYAAMAGSNFAIEKLRLNNDAVWPATGTYIRKICNTNPLCAPVGPLGSCDVDEPAFPCTINFVVITVGPPGVSLNGTRTIQSRVDYSIQ